MFDAVAIRAQQSISAGRCILCDVPEKLRIIPLEYGQIGLTVAVYVVNLKNPHVSDCAVWLRALAAKRLDGRHAPPFSRARFALSRVQSHISIDAYQTVTSNWTLRLVAGRRVELRVLSL